MIGSFSQELSQILDRVLHWSREFKHGNRDYDFNIDDELYKISKDHDKNFQEGDLLLVYNLLDFYCDAIEHGFKQIKRDYSIAQARSDIERVKDNLVETTSILILPEDLKKRLEGI